MIYISYLMKILINNC